MQAVGKPAKPLWTQWLDRVVGVRGTHHLCRILKTPLCDSTAFLKWHILRASSEEAAFLPTGALQLFQTLRAARPDHFLFAADFDSLPDVRIPGVNAPLVAATVRMLPKLTYVEHTSCMHFADDAVVPYRCRALLGISIHICCHVAPLTYSFRKASEFCQLSMTELPLRGQQHMSRL